MNYKNIGFVVLFLITQTIFSQVKITGKVVTKGNIAIEGANVIVSNENKGKKGIMSDTDGAFSITLKENGIYNVVITFVGYESYTNKVTISGNQKIDLGIILLKESTELLQSVEIIGRKRKDYNSDYSFSATKVAIKNKELPQSVATVTKELMDDKVAFQLSDAVKGVSSVTPVSMYNHFNIRGITQNEDGQVLNGMRIRQFYFLQPLTQNIERVEVVKGPSSVTFSSADPGGTVNIVTKKPLAEERKEVTFGMGSFNTIRGGLDFTGPLNEEKTLLYRLNAAVQEAKSFRDLVQNNAVLVSPSFSFVPNDHTSINIEMIYNSSTGNLDRGQPVFEKLAGEKFNLKSTPISRNIAATNDFNKTKEWVTTISFSHRLHEGVQLNAKYMKQLWNEDLQEHRYEKAVQDENGDPVSGLVGLRYAERKQSWNTDNISAFLNFDYKLGDAAEFKTVIGYDLHRFDKTIGGGVNSVRRNLKDADGNEVLTAYNGINIKLPAAGFFDLNNPSNIIRNTNSYNLYSGAIPAQVLKTHGAYIQNVAKFYNFSLLFSLRQEWFEDDFNYGTANRSKNTFNALIPRVGLSYEINSKLNVYATYLEGFQPHAYTTGLMPSVANYFWNNDRLSILSTFKPLTSSLEEIGVKGRFFNGKVNVSVAAFRIRQKNILLVNTDATNDLGIEINQRGEDRSQGIEFDVNGQLLRNLQISASGSYVDAEIVKSDDPLLIGKRTEAAPRWSGNLWAKYSFNDSSVLRGVSFGSGIQYSGNKLAWYQRDLELPDYTVVDIAAYYKPLNSNFEFTFKLNNLFDRVYWTGALNNTRLFPGAPQNFMLTTTYKF